MVNIKIPLHDRNIEGKRKSLNNWKIPEAEKKKLLKFLDELGLGKVNKGMKISESRQAKYLDMLKTPLEYFNKLSEKITLKDMEQFEKDLSSGKIQSNREVAYSQSTKVDIRRGLKVYLRWRIGSAKADKLTDWLDTRTVTKTPDYLNEIEITKLYKNCKSAQERFLIAILFDSGARAEEFHNIRYEDIQLPKDKDNFVKLTLKEEYSKTKGRVISLYWKYTKEAVEDFLREKEMQGIRSNDQVFTNSYESTRKFLQRLGKKVLKKSIHYHLFRHSSATYYATKLNRQEICYRYGWKFSSDMPDIYISRAGMENKELDQKFTATELEEIRAKLEREVQMNKITQEDLVKSNKKMQEDLVKVAEVSQNQITKLLKKIEQLEKMNVTENY